MGIFVVKSKISSEGLVKIQWFIFGIKVLSYTLRLDKHCKKNDIILCYDSLYDENAEAVDAFSFFKYLQQHNIPSRYVLLRGTRLHKELKKKKKLKDIILIDHIDCFFWSCRKILRRSKVLFSAFGLYEHFDKVLAKLPHLTYIYAKHGVIFLKEQVLNMYSADRFNKIVCVARPESELMKKHGTWLENLQIKSGMPRWDNLKRIPHNQKNIFLFFTWRRSIAQHPETLKIYADRINQILNNKDLLDLVNRHNLKLNFATHHAMLKNRAFLDTPQHVNLVPADNISNFIGMTDLLITDYSSIAFDFMFLDTPVIFYKFDADVNYPDEDDNINLKLAIQKDKELYNCLYSADDVVHRIEEYINTDFQATKKEKEINSHFFFTKINICENLYNQIKEL